MPQPAGRGTNPNDGEHALAVVKFRMVVAVPVGHLNAHVGVGSGVFVFELTNTRFVAVTGKIAWPLLFVFWGDTTETLLPLGKVD